MGARRTVEIEADDILLGPSMIARSGFKGLARRVAKGLEKSTRQFDMFNP